MTNTPQSIAPFQAKARDGAPAADRIPAYPATWYRFCDSRELGAKPLSKPFLGRRLVAHRTDSGKVVVMDARCAHLAADLGLGHVRGENIQCPFHGWEYGPSGACVHVPGEIAVPPFARQTVYPAVERHGSLFIFNGQEPLFPLPFFPDAAPDDHVAGRPFTIMAECSWYMLTANGFDVAHFRTVHDRTLLAPPRVDCPDRFARRLSYSAEITGKSIFDVILRRTVGPFVNVTITSWGGPLVLVTGDFRDAQSRILIAAQPLGDHLTRAEIIVFAPRSRHRATAWLAEFVSLEVRRLFTQGFMKDDADRLPGITYRPQCLLASEQELIDFFNWLSELPRSTLQPQCEIRETTHVEMCAASNGKSKP